MLIKMQYHQINLVDSLLKKKGTLQVFHDVVFTRFLDTFSLENRVSRKLGAKWDSPNSNDHNCCKSRNSTGPFLVFWSVCLETQLNMDQLVGVDPSVTPPVEVGGSGLGSVSL